MLAQDFPQADKDRARTTHAGRARLVPAALSRQQPRQEKICHEPLEGPGMNSFPDFHSDGRAALARSYDYNGSPFDQAFPHLELAMEPRMATRPVSQQEDVVRRSMRQPVRQWHAFDPMGVSTPRYVNQPANTNQ